MMYKYESKKRRAIKKQNNLEISEINSNIQWILYDTYETLYMK